MTTPVPGLVHPPTAFGNGFRWSLDLQTEAGAALREGILVRLHYAFGLKNPRKVLEYNNIRVKTLPFNFMGSQPYTLRRSDLAAYAEARQRSPAAAEPQALTPLVGARPSLDIKSPAELYAAQVQARGGQTVGSRPVREPACSHYATWKSDGCRYLLFCARLGASFQWPVQFMVGRGRDDVFLVNLLVPDSFYEGTIVDGELMRDNKTFEVFDVVMSNGSNVVRNWSFYDRQTVLAHLVQDIRPCAAATFDVRLKHIVPLRSLRAFAWQHGLVHLDNFDLAPPAGGAPREAGQLTREVDGIIIYTNDAPVGTYRDPTLKKFKPLQSVDYLFCLDPEEGGVRLLVKDGKGLKVFAKQELEPTLRPFRKTYRYSQWVVYTGSAADLDRRVVECAYCPDDRLWKPLFVRPDKDSPNSVAVAMDTVESIAEGITLEELCRAAEGSG